MDQAGQRPKCCLCPRFGIGRAAEESPEPSAYEPASSLDDTAAWLQSLDEQETETRPETASTEDETAIWLKSLDEVEETASQPAQPAEGTASLDAEYRGRRDR